MTLHSRRLAMVSTIRTLVCTACCFSVSSASPRAHIVLGVLSLVALDHEPRDLFGHGNDDRPADLLLGLQPTESRPQWSSSGHVVHRVRRFWHASAICGDR